jgi:hypothetical protein
VNCVLGAGLHSYGFNTGGQGYVATYVVIQLIYVFVAWLIYRARQPVVAISTSPSTSGDGRGEGMKISSLGLKPRPE